MGGTNSAPTGFEEHQFTIEGVKNTVIVDIESATEEQLATLKVVVKGTLDKVQRILADIKSGKFTKDSEIVALAFGKITDKQFERVREVFEKVAKAATNEWQGLNVLGGHKLTIKCEKMAPEGKHAWILQEKLTRVTLTKVHLAPVFFTFSTRKQEGIYFHELTHAFANTKDHGYFVITDGTYIGYVFDGKPVDLTTAQLLENANTYERLFYYYGAAGAVKL